MGNESEERSRFLRLAKEFDDNYVASDFILKKVVEPNKKPTQTNKQFLQENKDIGIYMYSQLNYKKLKSLVNVKETEKAFKRFYSLDDEDLNFIFRSIHITQLFLFYFQEYQFDRLRKYDEKKRLSKKYKAVIEDLEALKFDEKCIKVLEDRKNSLYRTFPTEQNIFEDFLHSIHIVLVKRGEGATHNLTDTTCEVVNLIIKNYFDKDITFSRGTDFKTFDGHTYQIESEKISLLHKRISNK